MTPDYAPAILKAFLHARVVFGAVVFGSSEKSAWRSLRKELRTTTKLKAADLDAAYAGRLSLASARTKLWAALGVFPADFAVLLDDKGSQQPKPHYCDQQQDDGPQWSPAAMAALEQHKSGGLSHE